LLRISPQYSTAAPNPASPAALSCRARSDANSAYVEVQAGLMRNQETYAFLEPRQSIHFTEYWMPVRAIGGIARANLGGVLHLHREGGSLIAGFNANRPVAGAKVRIP